MDGVSVLVGAVGGALGGNIGGTLLRKYSLGTAGNSIVGAIGGGIGSWVLGPWTQPAGRRGRPPR
jgi:uncharacterized membrane protein YeaQ/YmgE (transglycosylase-associated protein family)